MPRMSETEYNENVRYWSFHLMIYPILVCLGIYVVGTVIESLFGFQLGISKKIFVGIGGIGYFIWYFKNELGKKY